MKFLLVAVAVALMWSCVIAATTYTCEYNEHLDVKIVASYSPPLSFYFKAPSYRAGSALNLSCVVEGAGDNATELFYEWTSTCKGSCFSRGGTLKTVSSRYLHSYDQGVHTCVVHGQGGCGGNASITVDVVGGGIFVESPISEVLPNNSLIVASGYFPRAHSFRGLSGSNKSDVGQLIDPLGNDITHSFSDPFIVSRGRSYDPGSIYVRSFRALNQGEVGIYTYRTPEEDGNIVDVNLGIYSSYFSSHPIVTDLDFSLGGDAPFSLFCSSLNSPPTEVLWKKDSKELSLNSSTGKYKTSQVLVNRTTSAYVSMLTLEGVLSDVVGEYSCTVVNSIGTSNTISTTIKPIEITGHESPIIVGLSRIINCTTMLNIIKIEWVLVGVGMGDPVEERNDGGKSLEVSLTPEATELNGARFTCRVTTVNRDVLEETITVVIKELDHVVAIEDDTSPILVGEKVTLVCAVTCDFVPSVKWLDKDNNPVTIDGNSLFTEEPFTDGNITYLYLNFDPVKSSHGGRYSCQSSVSYPPSTKMVNRNVVIQLVPELVSIIQSPAGHHFMGMSLTLTCFTILDTAVDIAVQISHEWFGPSGLVESDSQKSVGQVTGSRGRFGSSLIFFALESSDSGNYSCSSVVRPETYSIFIASSTAESTTVLLNAVIQVGIEISYTSPDPSYFPPNYRAATAVTLTCIASGTTGQVTYLWSSTCSNCFVPYSSSSTISKTFLVAHDAGVHTCTVIDSSGDTGSNETIMNIIGSGIYVDNSLGTGMGLSSGAQPDNSYAIVDTEIHNSYASTRFSMYCCSNSSSSLGTILFPDGVALTSGEYSNGYVTQYTGSTSTYGGCIRFYYSYGYYNYLNLDYPGIYTCSFGASQMTNIGLYSEGSSTYVDLFGLERSPRDSNILNIICMTASFPPTSITWYKDDIPLNLTQGNVSMTTIVTDRWNSYYEITLLVEDVPDNLIGTYSVTVGNDVQTTNLVLFPSLEGLQVVCNNSLFIVGEADYCICSSDLEPASISWYKGEQVSPFCSQTLYPALYGSVSGSSSAVIRVGTEDHGVVYRCVSNTPYGSQEKSFEVQVEVPNNWATTTIPRSSALLNNSFTMSCEVNTIPGMSLPVYIKWILPNGTEVTTKGNRTVGSIIISILASSQMEESCRTSPSSVLLSSLPMTFDSIRNSDGGRYTCQAAVHVPWMRQQPQQLSATTEMLIITQALFQLKIYPVTHCSTWDYYQAWELDASIKTGIEKAVKDLCKCTFNVSAINSGEFSCQPRSCDSESGCGISTTAISHVTYRAIINGTSSLLTADEILGYIEEWRGSSGTLLHKDMFRLRIFKECQLEINSFDDDDEC